MVECIDDFYTDKNKILTMLEYGNPKERQIALESLSWSFKKENHYELAWRIFLSDEHMDVKKCALSVACTYASEKQLFEIIDFILQNKLKLHFAGWEREPNFERVILWRFYHELFDKFKRK